ncbi:Two-component response regulator 24 [Bienertia sinuspersici]
MATTSAKKLVALIVDDDSINRAINMKCLDRVGFDHIKIAENGQEAVDYFQGGNQFDLVIMDMEMSIMNGIQDEVTADEEGWRSCRLAGDSPHVRAENRQ